MFGFGFNPGRMAVQFDLTLGIPQALPDALPSERSKRRATRHPPGGAFRRPGRTSCRPRARRWRILLLTMAHPLLDDAFAAIVLLGAFVLTRVLGSLLYDVSATDPLTGASPSSSIGVASSPHTVPVRLAP